MRIRWNVAWLWLLLPAVTGCPSALPPATNDCYLDAASNHTTLVSADDDNVSPAQFESPEPLPLPHVDDEAPETTLSLADLEGIALQSNPTLATAAARMNAARGKQLQAGLFPNPVAGYQATEVGNQGTAGQQGGFISQRIITGGKLRLDVAIAGTEFDEAHIQFHAQQQRVLNDLRVKFYEALVAQQKTELAKELASLGDQLVVATEKLIDGRLATENDRLQAEIRADESHMLLDNATHEELEAWRRLVAIVGLPRMPPSRLEGNLDDDVVHLDWDRCRAMVMEGNPELNAALARVDRASVVARRARAAPIPNIDLTVAVRHHNVTDDEVANVQVGLPIPFFDRNQGNRQAAEAEWTAARNEVRRIELTLHDRLAVAYRRYANARQQVDRYRTRMVPKAKRSLQLVIEGYEKGQVQYLTLLASQRTYLEVNLAYLDSLRELRIASSIIEGQLLTGSLTNRR